MNFLKEKINPKNYTLEQKLRGLMIIVISLILILAKENILPSYIVILIFLLNGILLSVGKINEIEFIMYSLIMPSELYNFIGIGIGITCMAVKLLLRKIKINYRKNDKFIIALGVVIFISAIVSIFVTKVILNSIISVTYLFIMLFIYRVTIAMNYSFKELFKSMNNIFQIEFLAIIVQLILHGKFEPSDAFAGTFNNAHMFCVWLVWYLILLCISIYKNQKNNKISFILRIVILFIMLYLSDGKHIWGAALLGIIVWAILGIIKPFRNIKILITGLGILISLFVITNVVNNYNTKKTIEEKSSYVYRYLYEPPYNNKFNYFNQTLNNRLTGYHLLIGYGPGQYGSRTANLRAYEYMAKDSPLAIKLSKIISPYVLNEYKDLASEYNEEYLSHVKYMSAILSYPFSSIIAIIAELGLIGYLALLTFFASIEKNEDNKLYSLLPIILLILMVFDSYFEMTAIITFFWIIMGVSQKGSKKNNTLNYV